MTKGKIMESGKESEELFVTEGTLKPSPAGPKFNSNYQGKIWKCRGRIVASVFLALNMILLGIIILLLCNSNVDTSTNANVQNASNIMVQDVLINSLVLKGRQNAKGLLSKMDSDEWELYKKTSPLENTYKSRKRNMFKISGEMPRGIKEILQVLFYENDKANEWSSDADHTLILQMISEKTIISYMKTHSIGPVNSRDFIMLHHWEEIPHGIVIASESIEWETKKIKKPTNAVRGTYFLSGYRIREKGDGTKNCLVDFVFDCDMKISSWIPFQDSITANTLQSIFTDLRKKLLTMPESEEKHNDGYSI